MRICSCRTRWKGASVRTFGKASASQLRSGIVVEYEHTTSLKVAHCIAVDHLLEDPQYYTKLKRAGL